MGPPKPGDPFQVGDSSDVLEIELVEWGASRRPDAPTRPDFYVARTPDGDRYVLIPLDVPVLDVRWRGIPLRGR